MCVCVRACVCLSVFVIVTDGWNSEIRNLHSCRYSSRIIEIQNSHSTVDRSTVSTRVPTGAVTTLSLFNISSIRRPGLPSAVYSVYQLFDICRLHEVSLYDTFFFQNPV